MLFIVHPLVGKIWLEWVILDHIVLLWIALIQDNIMVMVYLKVVCYVPL